MYSKEEAKSLREDFWEAFRSMSARKRLRRKRPARWLQNNTGIKALNLRFHVDREAAQVGIDIETKNMEKRLELYEKLESVKKKLEEAMGEPMIWAMEYIRENGKSVSRVYVQREGIDIYNQDTWKEAHEFMFDKMMLLEDFYREHRDFFKYG
ncbi:MAG: DUF4268 domain-containing protein [Bacteroidales bacterium]